ncbi:uncharacterized protein LOC109857570 [Pseudomyrmex gracilis]|uniref:uncharacterized protein LOC109857570 n=1 Tax=Pseudomyrmex gracilis TaxID=219809 RepID=UPI000994FB87|nr:uncharacterized protein LOC109857570 [Pseudomyrmex gracilis]
MTADNFNTSSSFTLKTEQTVRDDDLSDDDIFMEHIDKLSFMPLPSISINNNALIFDQSNEYLRLTTMVRNTYLSYLHKCLLNNYETCYEEREDDEMSAVKIKKCADQMELHAVRLALESQLYRENMLRLIKDIKSHTINRKAYKTLVIFLEEPRNTFDVAVQTDKSTWMDVHEIETARGTCISPNDEKMSPTASLTLNLSSIFENTNVSEDFNNETEVQQTEFLDNTLTMDFNNASQRTEVSTAPQLTNDITFVKNEDEDSQDSLLQHMEDMFGESDDSSDLTKLIEKHSDCTKVNSNVNNETNQKCLETDIDDLNNIWGVSETTTIPSVKRVNANKLSFRSYKERQRRNKLNKANRDKSDEHDNVSDQQQRINAVWFVERVHQVSKFKAKMTELSLRNYRKHRKIKEKFFYLFGECGDDDELMLDSPICIEDYLPACKDRIAPWIVKYLMPFYKKRRIKNRHLFKAVAKYITDMLIIENTFPEETSVSKYIKDYFKSGKCIKIKQDIFL